MNLMTMRFKDFTWQNNPTELTVELGRRVKETLLPYAGSVSEDLGEEKRKVKGEGYFSGETAMTRWQELRTVFDEGGPGSLQLPGQEPFLAVMESLKLIGMVGKDLVKYSFSFTEYRRGQEYTGENLCTAKAGESLWDYAREYKRSIDQLAEANPHIRNISALAEGEQVRIP